MIGYYTEYMGMSDTISKDDMYVGINRTVLQKQSDEMDNKIALLNEQMELRDKEFKEMMDLAKALQLEAEIEIKRRIKNLTQ
jgi:hypothetical protein